MSRILLHTLGSAGDFNPFVALGLELQRRGHSVRFAVSPANAQRIIDLGMDAVAIGPDLDPDSALMRKLLAPEVIGPIDTLFRNVLIPAIEPATDAIVPLCKDADLFVSHIVQLAAPVIAHRTGIRWISATPTTNCYPSRSGDAPGIAWRNPPVMVNRLAWAAVRGVLWQLDTLLCEQYLKLGTPPRGDSAILGTYSELMTIGLWSPAFFPRPDDWPEWFQVGGYARWDAQAAVSGPRSDIPQGPGPLVVFTLGSSVVNDPRGYYEMAMEAIRPTNWRAVLLGAPDDFPIPTELAGRVVASRYAQYAALFPAASAIVHQGGVGTTQAACYYGVPSIVVPRGFDQFENAAHIQRHRLGLRIMPSALTPRLLRIRLERLLTSGKISKNVTSLAGRMQDEPGVSRSADLVELALDPGYSGAPSQQRSIFAPMLAPA